MNLNRRKVLNEQDNEIPQLEENDQFARILNCESGDIFYIEIVPPGAAPDDENVQLKATAARMLPKFKHVLFAKQGDLVIITPESEQITTRTPFVITSVLSSQHIKYFVSERQLPAAFVPSKMFHKQFGQKQLISQSAVNERFLGQPFGQDDDQDAILPEINNRRRLPFQDESSSEEEEEDEDDN